MNLDFVTNLQELPIDQLKARALEVGANFEENYDAAAIIDAILEASNESNEQEEGEKLKPGVCISLRTNWDDEDRKQRCLEFIQAARQAIENNQAAEVFFQTVQANRDNKLYRRRLPGVEVKKQKALDSIMEAVSPLPGEQQDMMDEFKANPERFETPVLVRVYRANQSTDQNGRSRGRSYVMLYLKHKQKVKAVSL